MLNISVEIQLGAEKVGHPYPVFTKLWSVIDSQAKCDIFWTAHPFKRKTIFLDKDVILVNISLLPPICWVPRFPF